MFTNSKKLKKIKKISNNSVTETEKLKAMCWQKRNNLI